MENAARFGENLTMSMLQACASHVLLMFSNIEIDIGIWFIRSRSLSLSLPFHPRVQQR